jgi:hypothetical protein
MEIMLRLLAQLESLMSLDNSKAHFAFSPSKVTVEETASFMWFALLQVELHLLKG